MASIYHGVGVAANITESTIVMFSGGKDSVVTLDLCFKYFKHVQPVFMYLGPILSFQQAQLKWAEDKYGVEIIKVPHPMLAEWLRYGTFKAEPDLSVPIISFLDIYTYVRTQTGIYWIAAGERINDSIVRRAMIKSGGGSINKKRGRFFPVAYWTKLEIINYIKLKRLKTAPESRLLGFSFRSLMPADMAAIREHYYMDYLKINEWFPLLGASVAKHEFAQEVINEQ